MRPRALLPILACLAASGCSTMGQSALSTDVWLCAYQLGDRYRTETSKPDVIKFDLVPINPVRRIELTYLLPVEGGAPAKRTITCETLTTHFGVIAMDGLPLNVAEPDAYPNDSSLDFTSTGRSAAVVRDAVRATGIHVHIPGTEGF